MISLILALILIIIFGIVWMVVVFWRATLEENQKQLAQFEENQLRSFEKSQQLESLLQEMQEGVITTDEEFRIQLSNPAFYRIFSLQDRCEGKTILEALRHHEIDQWFHLCQEANQAREGEIVIHHPQEKNIFVRISRLSPQSFLAVFFDVSRIHQLENTRREFVANVSHELRTPLTSILGYAETLRSGALSDPQAAENFLSKIERNAQLLKNLIEDLLRISQLESGRFELRFEKIDLKELLGEIDQEFRERFQKAGLTFRVETLDLIEIRAERSSLKQILGNLLDNAMKYTPTSGEVVLRTSLDSADNKIRIEVQDTGLGIPTEDLPYIFERFYRVDKARSREMGGTGLGLSIVKHMVQMMGGEVGVESEFGQGSQFFFTLPLFPKSGVRS